MKFDRKKVMENGGNRKPNMMVHSLRRRLLRRKSLILTILTIFMAYFIYYGPKLLIRDIGYLTRPIWDAPGPQPNTIIPRYYSDSLSPETLCHLHNWAYRKEKPKVIDAVIFSVELDILEMRMKELWDVVDIFLVLESDTTFTGKSKPLVLEKNKKRFEWAASKLRVISIKGNLNKNPKTEFENERDMRFTMTRQIRRLPISKGDLIIVADVDEVPRQEAIKLIKNCEGYPPELHLEMKNYIYSFQFNLQTTNWKPHISVYHDNFYYYHHLAGSDYILADAGWHCSFCFRNLNDFVFKMTSYSHSDRVTSKRLLRKDVIQKKVCEGSDIFEMFAEAYSYKELVSLWGNAKQEYTTGGLPKVVVDEYDKFSFLLPGGCIRQDGEDYTNS